MDRVPLNVPLTDTAQAKPFQRVEVITGIARRRRWSEQDKAKIVAESLEPGVIVADVARRYGLHRNQLYDWRAAFGIRPDKSAPKRPRTRARRRRSCRSPSCPKHRNANLPAV
jgi:transposase-like protein